jgi:hypothetical protein
MNKAETTPSAAIIVQIESGVDVQVGFTPGVTGCVVRIEVIGTVVGIDVLVCVTTGVATFVVVDVGEVVVALKTKVIFIGPDVVTPTLSPYKYSMLLRFWEAVKVYIPKGYKREPSGVRADRFHSPPSLHI